MGKVKQTPPAPPAPTTAAEIAAELSKVNPRAGAMDVRIYSDALLTYREAAANIEKCGAIVTHPRTGAPIENPYLRIRTQAGAVLAKMRHIRCPAELQKG